MQPILETNAGRVQGIPGEHPGITLYRGIPYAKAPTGARRFAPPEKPDPWDGVFFASQEPPVAWQHFQEPGSFYDREFYENHTFVRDENCLVLNVTAPTVRPETPLPVFFWIHGGAFLHGNGHEKEFDGETFVQNGVLYVSINYRTGAFGFLTDPELDAENEEGVSGNYAILDQIAALRWVQENIRAFGGDPKRVTIAGQSAGCMSVLCLLYSPWPGGLFSQAILQSAYGIFQTFGGPDAFSKAAGEEAARRLKRELGVSTVAELRALDAETLCDAWYRVADGGETLCWVPHPDGVVLEEGLLSATASPDPAIRTLIGCTGDDIGCGEHHFLREAAHRFAQNAAAHHCPPPYVYFFDRKLPGDDAGAFHSAELWYVFHTLSRCWRPMEPRDGELADCMSAYWANFVRTGDPNGPGLPCWKPFTREDPFERLLK